MSLNRHADDWFLGKTRAVYGKKAKRPSAAVKHQTAAKAASPPAMPRRRRSKAAAP